MKYRKEIDGLRAIAVIPVILFHAGFEHFSGGFVGVDVFFVVSGYLITTIILSEKEKGTFSLINFYEKRARRIIPALFLVMLASTLAAWFLLSPAHMKDFSQSLVAVSLFSSNILFWQETGYWGAVNELKPLLHTWSLAVEEQYYVLFPLFLMLMWRFSKRWILSSFFFIALGSLSLSQWAAYNLPAANFFLLPTRGWEWAIGAGVAFYFLYRKNIMRSLLSHKAVDEFLSFFGLILIGYAVFVFDEQTPFPSLYALVPTIGTGLVLIFASKETLSGKLLGSKILVAIGLISYSTYLWHQPLFVFARHISLEEPSKVIFGILSIISILLACISWKFVETPFRKKGRFSRKHIFSLTLIGSAVFITFGLIGHMTDGYKTRLSNAAIKIEKSANDASVSNLNVLGDISNIEGVILGDSHAGAIVHSLNDALINKKYGLKSYIKYGCPPLRGLYRHDMVSYGDACDLHYKRAYREIISDNTLQTVVIIARFTLYLESSRFDNGEGGIERGPTTHVIYDDIKFKNQVRPLSQRQALIADRIVEDVKALIGAVKKVVLVYPIPEVGWDPPSIGIQKAWRSDQDVTISTSFKQFMTRNAYALTVLDSLGEHENLKRVYPHKYFCNTYIQDRCIAIYKSNSFYRDSNHLSDSGANLIVDEIVKSTVY
jgi:peptidoglycan/LPS O-acetylase OafA/YrhL